MRAAGRIKQEACRGENKRAETRGRGRVGMGVDQVRRAQWNESGASGRTRRMR